MVDNQEKGSESDESNKALYRVTGYCTIFLVTKLTRKVVKYLY
jgi:hypothetical protein